MPLYLSGSWSPPRLTGTYTEKWPRRRPERAICPTVSRETIVNGKPVQAVPGRPAGEEDPVVRHSCCLIGISNSFRDSTDSPVRPGAGPGRVRLGGLKCGCPDLIRCRPRPTPSRAGVIPAGQRASSGRGQPPAGPGVSAGPAARRPAARPLAPGSAMEHDQTNSIFL